MLHKIRRFKLLQIYANFGKGPKYIKRWSLTTLHYPPLTCPLLHHSFHYICTRTSGAYAPLVLAPAEGVEVLWAPCLFVFFCILLLFLLFFVFLHFCLFVILPFAFLSFCLFVTTIKIMESISTTTPIFVPKCLTETKLTRSTHRSRAYAYNNLPKTVTQQTELKKFKKELKKQMQNKHNGM